MARHRYSVEKLACPWCGHWTELREAENASHANH